MRVERKILAVNKKESNFVNQSYDHSMRQKNDKESRKNLRAG